MSKQVVASKAEYESPADTEANASFNRSTTPAPRETSVPTLLHEFKLLMRDFERAASAYRGLKLSLQTHWKQTLPDERPKGLPIIEFKVPDFSGTETLNVACDLKEVHEFEPTYPDHIMVPMMNYFQACTVAVLAEIREALAVLEPRLTAEIKKVPTNAQAASGQ